MRDERRARVRCSGFGRVFRIFGLVEQAESQLEFRWRLLRYRRIEPSRTSRIGIASSAEARRELTPKINM